MAGKLQDEIRKRKGFDSLEQEAFLNLLRTVEKLSEGVSEVLKASGLSSTQYNALRILRGAGACCGETGIACREVADRMVTRDPDITRLFDRLESRGLITRTRNKEDRRVVKTAITDEGLKVLKQLDAPVMELHKRQLGKMGERKLKAMIELLEEARASAE